MRTGSKSGRALSEAVPKTCPGLVSACDGADASRPGLVYGLIACSGVEPDLVDLLLRIRGQRIADLQTSARDLQMRHPDACLIAGDLEHLRAEVLRVVRT